MEDRELEIPPPPVDDEDDDGDDGVECATCGVYFDSPVIAFRRKDHATFYCPNGHGNVFREKTKEDILTEELTKERQLRVEAENKLSAKSWWRKK